MFGGPAPQDDTVDRVMEVATALDGRTADADLDTAQLRLLTDMLHVQTARVRLLEATHRLVPPPSPDPYPGA